MIKWKWNVSLPRSYGWHSRAYFFRPLIKINHTVNRSKKLQYEQMYALDCKRISKKGYGDVTDIVEFIYLFG